MSAVAQLPSRFLESVYSLRRRVASEETFLEKALEKFAGRDQTLLEVGCGYCRFHPIVKARGLAYTGIDKNPEIVEQNVSNGIECLLPSVGMDSVSGTDVLFLSHIIEHFDYEGLVGFLNDYLPKVHVGGLVIIFTPVFHRGFYDDFDHVKPYNPAALRQVFVQAHAQTQLFGVRGRFVELDFWVKRDSLWHSYRERQWMHLIKVPLSLLNTVTFGCVGRVTGYGVVFKKIGD